MGSSGATIAPHSGAKRLPWQMPPKWTSPYAQYVNDLPGLIGAVTANGEKWVSELISRLCAGVPVCRAADLRRAKPLRLHSTVRALTGRACIVLVSHVVSSDAVKAAKHWWEGVVASRAIGASLRIAPIAKVRQH